jgi:hypothetical protein
MHSRGAVHGQDSLRSLRHLTYAQLESCRDNGNARIRSALTMRNWRTVLKRDELARS